MNCRSNSNSPHRTSWWRKSAFLGGALLFSGLANAQVLFDEAFTGNASSEGFSIVDNGSSGCAAVYGNPGARTITGVGFDADFAMFDSDICGSGTNLDAYFYSPTFDASTGGFFTLAFDHQYRVCCGSVASVDVWDGAAWTSVYSLGATSVGYGNPAVTHSTDITAATGGSAAAQVRFHYAGSWDYWWALDNISVTRVAPPAGCLTAINGQYPFSPYVPACTGSPEDVTTCGWSGEYSMVTLTSGTSYTFTSDQPGYYITISDAAGATALAAGTMPVVFMAASSGDHRFYTHTDAACGDLDAFCTTRSVTCSAAPPVYCDMAQGTPGFPSDAGCEASVCGYDAYCCSTSWDAYCAGEAASDGACTGCLTPGGAPPNDDCALATVIGDGVSPFDNTGATGTDISSCCYSDTKDIWYEYVASCTGTTTVTTVGGTAMDTGLSAWDACGGSEIVCNDDDGGLQSTITFATVSGTSYWIRLAGYSGSTGSGTFTVSCAPVVPCTNDLVMELQTDFFGGETSWEVVPAGGGAALCGGGPGIYPGNAIYPIACCLPDGCYELHVYDTFGDGMVTGGFTGGYTLRMLSGQRIIDNRNNYGDFAAGSSYESTMSATPGFCLPMGNDRLISFSCDRLDLRRGVGPNSCSDKITADNTPNGTSGNVYQFWFYDPNGSLSFRYPANGPGSNQVSMANLPSLVEGTLYNVRVRTRISPGVWREWGNACRMMIDNTRGQCKLSGLVDEVGNSNYCCGKTITLPVGNQGNGFANHVVAWPAVRFNNNCVNSTANKYQFRFRIPAEAVTIVLNSPTNVKYMTAGAGFANCKTYTVEVRASFDNGYSWCVGGDPYGDLTPWGKVCEVYTSCPPPAVGGNQNMATDDGAAMHMYPNPNRGDQLYLSLDAIQEGVQTVSVDIYDTFGKRVSARTLAVQDGFINSVLELNGELATGLYMVNITAGDAVYTQRLVIQK
ncbi:MAG: T9SS type A sorting domain-containing protein [Flavobacteriales bacterium]|nr:T9SS type A sorting domain-containing protein [Flavobacteriales bacterium]